MSCSRAVVALRWRPRTAVMAARPGPAAAARRRPPQPAGAGDRPELLLRDGGPVPERHRGQRPRRAAARQERGSVGLRPDRQGLVPRRRPPGAAQPARVHQGPRHHRHLADPELQEQGGPGQQRLPLGRLPRLLDHRLHADRPAPGHQRRPARADPRRAPARHEGLLRHHHQPHGGRHPLRRRARRRPTSPRTSIRTAPPPARCSTTATSPGRTRSRRWRRAGSRRARRRPARSRASPTTRACRTGRRPTRSTSRTSRSRPGSTT